MARSNGFTLFVFLLLVAAAAFTGYLWPPGDWYGALQRPIFAPPNWVFGPVWTALYLMLAVAAWLVWRKTGWRSRPLTLWYVQLGLNALWTPLFFGLHWMGVALIELALLWLVIIVMLRSFARVSALAAWLLVPYLAWVTFAWVLNAGFWWLNREPVMPIPPATAHLEREADALMDDWLTLADDAMKGRRTGTDDYLRAADYVHDRLAGFVDDAGLQQVPYRAATIERDSERIVIELPSHHWNFTAPGDFTIAAHPTETEIALKAKAVFVGYGVRAPEAGYDDYADMDVDGKVVVVMNGVPKSFDANQRAFHTSSRRKAELAVAAGAVGMITVRNARQVDRREWRAPPSYGERPSISLADRDDDARLSFRAGVSDNTARLMFSLAEAGYPELLQRDQAGEPLGSFPLQGEFELVSRQTHETFEAPNVYGIIRGTDPELADEYIVLSAHLDGLGVGEPVAGDPIRNGAYDNALGTAMIIEVGRRIAAERPRRPVVLALVGGEEQGLLGSDHFARNPPMAGRMVANLNIDMALFLFPVTEIVGFGAEHTTLGALAEAAAEAEGFTMAPDPFPDEVFFVRSDHYSFVRQGIPALFLDAGTGTTDPDIDGELMFRRFLRHHYHKPRDDVRVPVDWPSVERFIRVAEHITRDAADADAPPAWLPDSYFGKTFSQE